MLDALSELIPPHLKHTLQVRGMSLTKIPLLFFSAPTVLELTDRRVEIRIPLSWRTKNHWGSMYFGALAIGADCAGGLIAWERLEEANKSMKRAGERARIDLIFKDFQANFLKRPEGDVHFSCEDGEKISELVEKAV